MNKPLFRLQKSTSSRCLLSPKPKCVAKGSIALLQQSQAIGVRRANEEVVDTGHSPFSSNAQLIVDLLDDLARGYAA